MNEPMECLNGDCAQLYCSSCCAIDESAMGAQCPRCQVGVTVPSKIIMKIYGKYEITCSVCCQSISVLDLVAHESTCQRNKCSNELCGAELMGAVKMNASVQGFGVSAANPGANGPVRFTINGNQLMACSKKCKKVAKFSYMLKQNNENQILKTFESMLRKKIQKNLEQASM